MHYNLISLIISNFLHYIHNLRDALSNHEINKFNNQLNWGDLATSNIPVGFVWLKAAMESLQIMGKDMGYENGTLEQENYC